LYDNTLDKTLKNVPKSVLESIGQVVRAESENGREWVKAGGCRTFEDLERFPENVLDLHHARMRWAGMDREIVSMETWVHRLESYCESEGIEPRRRSKVYRYLLAEGHGLAHGYGRAAESECRKIARASGVHPSDVRQVASTAVTYRCDFDNGRVLRSVA
jgi:hypothetical protein